MRDYLVVLYVIITSPVFIAWCMILLITYITETKRRYEL